MHITIVLVFSMRMSLQSIKQTSPLYLAFIIKLFVHMLMPSVLFNFRIFVSAGGNMIMVMSSRIVTICQRSSTVLSLSAIYDKCQQLFSIFSVELYCMFVTKTIC